MMLRASPYFRALWVFWYFLPFAGAQNGTERLPTFGDVVNILGSVSELFFLLLLQSSEFRLL